MVLAVLVICLWWKAEVVIAAWSWGRDVATSFMLISTSEFWKLLSPLLLLVNTENTCMTVSQYFDNYIFLTYYLSFIICFMHFKTLF